MQTWDCIYNCPLYRFTCETKELFEDIPIYCYNVDDNVLMTTDKQQTLIFGAIKVIKNRLHMHANTSDRLHAE